MQFEPLWKDANSALMRMLVFLPIEMFLAIILVFNYGSFPLESLAILVIIFLVILLGLLNDRVFLHLEVGWEGLRIAGFRGKLGSLGALRLLQFPSPFSGRLFPWHEVMAIRLNEKDIYGKESLKIAYFIEILTLDGATYIQGVEDVPGFIGAVKKVEEGKVLDISVVDMVRLKKSQEAA